MAWGCPSAAQWWFRSDCSVVVTRSGFGFRTEAQRPSRTEWPSTRARRPQAANPRELELEPGRSAAAEARGSLLRPAAGVALSPSMTSIYFYDV